MTGGIIVADDDVVMRGILRSILLEFGETVFLAACGQEVLALGAKLRPKLVLLDLNMPRLNGLVTCERLRQLPACARAPIVILTALEDDAARRASAVAGATLFLTKPFQPAALIRTLAPYVCDTPTQPAAAATC